MAYTFLKAEGFTVGKSLVEDDMLQTALEIKKRAEEKGIEFLLPTDHQVSTVTSRSKATRSSPRRFRLSLLISVSSGMDIGVETVAHFANALAGCAHDHLEWTDGCV